MTDPVTLWRVATETRAYKAEDLSGDGAAKSPGRWNAPGQHVLYAAPSPALAVLETAAHIDSASFPLNRYLVRLTVPRELWDARRELGVADLDARAPAWAAVPAGRASADVGSEWYTDAREPMLVVPSVIVPEESAVVINATHPRARLIQARIVRPVTYDKLFRR